MKNDKHHIIGALSRVLNSVASVLDGHDTYEAKPPRKEEKGSWQAREMEQTMDKMTARRREGKSTGSFNEDTEMPKVKPRKAPAVVNVGKKLIKF